MTCYRSCAAPIYGGCLSFIDSKCFFAWNQDMDAMKKEQTLLVYGILACLKGLKEQGCNGPVTEAINKIEKHLNQKAHQ